MRASHHAIRERGKAWDADANRHIRARVRNVKMSPLTCPRFRSKQTPRVSASRTPTGGRVRSATCA